MPIVQSINVISGVNQQTGKPWTRYDVVLDDGRTANGFAYVKIGDQVNVYQKGQYLNFTPLQNGTQSLQDAPQRVPDRSLTKDDYWQRKEDRDREWHAEAVRQRPRIERQHSQEMALRYFEIVGEVPLGKDKAEATAKLITMIDWFVRDIGRSPKSCGQFPVQLTDQLHAPPIIPQEPDEPPF